MSTEILPLYRFVNDGLERFDRLIGEHNFEPAQPKAIQRTRKERVIMIQTLRSILSNPIFLTTWLALVAVSFTVLIYDLRRKNPHIMSLMKWVWAFTVLYSGPIGLAIYYYSGRQQIRHDSLWRKGFRSVAHCYSGCGAGEIAGIFITVGLLSLGTLWVTGVTFVLAYVAGFALTVGPLMQEGVSFGQAFKDAAYSETASIAVMEIVAIGVDLWVAGNATMNELLFWSSLIFSLTLGLIAAYPVNLLLIKWGVKEGMMNPRKAPEMAHS
jgi:hypothetical protein